MEGGLKMRCHALPGSSDTEDDVGQEGQLAGRLKKGYTRSNVPRGTCV